MVAVNARILQQAIDLYLATVYPAGGVPPAVGERLGAIRALGPSENVPESMMERAVGVSMEGYAVRLGQPQYPHMKIVVEPAPASCVECPTVLLRVDAHDRHLHAAPGSPDEVWLSAVRASNKQLTDRVEAAWSQAGLPTFKDYLRSQLAARKAQQRGG